MKILEIRGELVIAEVNGNITTRPNSPYYTLKYTTYENARVAYTFSDVDYIQETYDDRIFNCWHNGKRLQLRQDLSNRLALCIQEHELTGKCEYDLLFTEAFNEIANYQILQLYLGGYKTVQYVKHEGFIIHDTFKIDLKGNAYQKHFGSNDWRSLCIVMQQIGHGKLTTACELADKDGIVIEINAITMTIISKVLFLVDPNMKDKEFFNQLSNEAKITLNKLRGGDNVW